MEVKSRGARVPQAVDQNVLTSVAEGKAAMLRCGI
jgi:hypothetical protein